MDLEKAITTQEELDKIIADRIKRAEAKVRKEYEGYDDLKKELEGLKGEKATASAAHQKELDALNARIKGYEVSELRTKVANEYSIPYQFQDRLKGTTQEELEADAKLLAPMFAKAQPRQEFRANDPKPEPGDKFQAALSTWLKSNTNQE